METDCEPTLAWCERWLACSDHAITQRFPRTAARNDRRPSKSERCQHCPPLSAAYGHRPAGEFPRCSPLHSPRLYGEMPLASHTHAAPLLAALCIGLHGCQELVPLTVTQFGSERGRAAQVANLRQVEFCRSAESSPCPSNSSSSLSVPSCLPGARANRRCWRCACARW